MISQKSCDGLPDHLNPRRTPKLCAIAHENGQKCPKSRVFTIPLESCIGGHGASKSFRDPKKWTISPENVQKCSKSRVFTMPLESWTGGHGASKSSRDPKNVDYSPQKRPEMSEITGIVLPGPKKRGLQPTKTARNARNHEFSRRRWSRVPGVTGHRNPPGTQKT